MGNREIIGKAVAAYIKRNESLIPFHHRIDENAIEHIKDIGTSIMMVKWELELENGGFVKAVIDNDLEGCVNRADNVCRDCLAFFVTLKNCLGAPDEVVF
jgi:hypothetical protein